MPNVYQFKDFEGSSHRILLRLIRRWSAGGRLLDIGAAGGELGRELADQFQSRTAIEGDPDQMGTLSEHFDRVIIADIESLGKLPPSDAIVLADVIEHLRSPAALLRMAREALSQDGLLFVSVPNIANITIRLGLLFGIFTYRERGILDATHLRFYTMKTIREELSRAGFRIVAVEGSSIPVRLIFPGMPEPVLRAGERITSVITRVRRALFAYQLILVARKVPSTGS